MILSAIFGVIFLIIGLIFKEGLLKGINEYYKKNWNAPEIRDGICGAISVKVQDPIFESQTKNKLGNTEIRSWIVNEVKEAGVDLTRRDTFMSVVNYIDDLVSQLENLLND